MELPNIFAYDNYQVFLADVVAKNRQHRGFLTKMAAAARCQKSHLSRMLTSNQHLTLEHVTELARFFSFDESETDYFLNLVLLNKAGTKNLEMFFKRRLKDLRRKKRGEVSRAFSEDHLPKTLVEQKYYRSWIWGAIHIATDVETLNTAEEIASRLALPVDVVNNVLNELQSFGLVAKDHQGWKIKSGSIHLNDESTMIEKHHFNWRFKALEDLNKPSSDGLHYSVVQSCSVATYEKIKRLLTIELKEISSLVRDSKAEEIVCLNIDAFRV
jgi:uncharacterized protein (TIGR02147 family)